MITYSGRDYVTVEEEMSFVRQYLKEEQLRIDFEFEIKCPYGLENFNIAPSFLQPLLENAIKHGVSALKDGKGFIRLSFLEHNENHLLCSVENKGPEFKEAGNQKKGTPKKIGGLDLINERFRVYNSLYKTNLGFIISNMEFEDNSRGVKVAIKIPAGKK
jgi:sensor histidine kinase YesM